MIECCGKFTKYQMDMIEENIRLYDCMKASEKHFIQEVCTCTCTHVHVHVCTCIHDCMCVILHVIFAQVKELTCDTYKSRFVLKELPRGKAVVQNMFLVCCTSTHA